MMLNGSHVLRVVLTVIEPSIRSSWQEMPYSLSNDVTCVRSRSPTAQGAVFSRY